MQASQLYMYREGTTTLLLLAMREEEEEERNAPPCIASCGCVRSLQINQRKKQFDPKLAAAAAPAYLLGRSRW